MFFTNSATCDECKKIYQQLKPLSEEYVVSCPFYLVDCAQNSSAEFCQEKGIINFPTVTIFKGKNTKTPVKFSRDQITSDDINVFIQKHSRPLFSKAKLVDLILSAEQFQIYLICEGEVPISF